MTIHKQEYYYERAFFSFFSSLCSCYNLSLLQLLLDLPQHFPLGILLGIQISYGLVQPFTAANSKVLGCVWRVLDTITLTVHQWCSQSSWTHSAWLLPDPVWSALGQWACKHWLRSPGEQVHLWLHCFPSVGCPIAASSWWLSDIL